MSVSKKIAIFMHDFRGGGAERVSVKLCNGLVQKKGVELTIFALKKEGAMLSGLNSNISIVELKSTNRMAFSFFELALRVSRYKPDIVISHMTHANVIAIFASLLGGFSRKLVVVEHNQMKQNLSVVKQTTVKLAYYSTKWLYKVPKKVVAVSIGVKKSVIDFTNIRPDKVDVIYNPVVDDTMLNLTPSKSKQQLSSFFELGVPVFIGIGSLSKQKNFPLFIKAFKLVKEKINAKAIILGEGSERPVLENMLSELGLKEDVSLPGFVSNPYEYVLNSDVFVLSSSWEGLPTVLIEALALNTKVVSTLCPSGPDEILNYGQFGELVELDDEVMLAEAMLKSLTRESTNLQKRALDFSVDKSVNTYFELME